MASKKDKAELAIYMIDRVLEWFAQDTNLEPNTEEFGGNGYVYKVLLEYDKVYNGVIAAYPDLNNDIFKRHFDAILRKLMSDEYLYFTFEVKSDNHEGGYYINMEGIIFSHQGGYAGVQKSLDAKNEYDLRFDDQAETNAQRLNWLTAILGIGTLALAISEGINIYTEHRQKLSLYLLLLTVSTAIVLLLLRKSRSKKKNTK